ncbi:hypothetical protein BJ170DRAFT_432449 [Xylariales sp. AK1849]|nr:hypothetical protein BJ170DRAFT_432449 [Xylariales sp. AK1849]
MGGLAFTKGANALHTPRMCPDIYQYVRDHCHRMLRELFVVVATPIEGPGKSDYGDVDIFVAWKRQVLFPSSANGSVPGASGEYPFDAIKRLLHAERHIQERQNVAIFAVPWPDNLPQDLEDQPKDSSNIARFVQVDIHICPSLENVEWFLFKHAHGDLWNLLGSIIRPYGLTVDEVGLYLRIPEIEKWDKKKAKVLLTKDPCQVLSFLGLKSDGPEWEEKFATTEDIYEYAATSHFFWVKPESSEADDAHSDGKERIGGEFERKKLKSNDRRRMGMRPLFRKWVEEFLPKCREDGRFTQPLMKRDQVRDEALRRFEVRQTYETRLLDFQKQRQKEALWRNVIKAALPDDLDPQWRSCTASALKKIIMEDDGSFGYRPSLPLRNGSGLYLEDDVRQYVRTSWRDVGQVAWQQNQARFQGSIAKGTKRTASGGEKQDA